MGAVEGTLSSSTGEYLGDKEQLRRLSAAIGGLDNSHFVALEGSYPVWQEVHCGALFALLPEIN